MIETSVDFFVLGAPKSGTTTVAEFFAAHPQIKMSRHKEPHFFDAYYSEDIRDYIRECFGDEENSVLRGEATPSYLAVPWVPERIAHHVPDAKMIVCLRNPVDRAFSSWWMLYSRGLENLSFEDAIAANMEQSDIFAYENAQKVWRTQIEAIARSENLPFRTYLETGHYYEHLKRYYSVFPKNRIHVIFSDKLSVSRNAVLAEALDFLGLDSDLSQLDLKESYNASYGKHAKKLLTLAKHLQLMRLRRWIPISLREPIKVGLSKMGTAPSMDQDMRIKLTRYFHDSNLRLEQLLEVDLAQWR